MVVDVVDGGGVVVVVVGCGRRSRSRLLVRYE